MLLKRIVGNAAALALDLAARPIEMARDWLPRGAKRRVRAILAAARERRPLPVADGGAAPEPLAAGAPLVTVVIPCLDYGRWIEESVASVRQQSLGAVEIIVVDYGSSEPATLAALGRLAGAGIHILRVAQQGVEAARNAGIAAGRGRYLCCLDADDLLAPDYLEKCCLVLEADGGVGFAYSWVRLFGDTEGIWETADFDLTRARHANHAPCASVFRRRAWEAVGGYDPRMGGGYEDWEFWIRLAAAGWRGLCIPEPLFLHRRHGRSMTHAAQERHEELMGRMRALNPRVFTDRGFRAAAARAQRRVRYRDPFRNLTQEGVLRATGEGEGMLILLPWLTVGGAETVMLSILRGLAPGRRIHIATTLAADHPMHDAFAAVAETIHHLPALLHADERDAWLVALCRARRLSTVLISACERGYALAPRLKRSIPGLRIIDLLHNDDPTGHLANSVAAGSAIDLRVGVNELIRTALLRAGIPGEGVAVVLNGVDSDDTFDPAAQDRAAVRAALGIPAERVVVTLPARLSPEKRPIAFLRAAARTEDPRLHFLIVGDGPCAPLVRAALCGPGLRGRATWLGAIPPARMPAIYAASDLVTLTSSIEGLPMSLLEALAMGVPVLSTDVGQVSAAVSPDENGFLVPPDAVGTMTALIDRFAADSALRARLAAAARPGLLDRGLTASAMRAAWRRLLAAPAAAGAASISPPRTRADEPSPPASATEIP